MATLSEALRKNRSGQTVRGVGGQLNQETPEEVQTLAGQAGLQAPPITPLGTAIIGGNPDQTKMAGTPAQKEAALSLSLQPQQTLSGALRQQQVRTQQTGAEQQQTQKNTDMQNLGNLGDRVTQFIDTQRQLLEEQQAPVDVAAQTQFQGQDISSLKDTLAALRADPNNMQLQLEVNKALGRNINTTLSPDEVNKLYEDSVASIARGGAANVDDSLTVSDLVSQGEFGYDAAEIAQLLGIPEQQAATLTVGQLRNEIQRVGDQEFSNTQRLEQQAQSGLLGQAERGLARQAAREASATGVRATEADYSNLEQQIQNADQVTFAGKSMNVEELLKDETISKLITDYLQAPEGSPERAAIDNNEPGLKSFIERNKAILEDASQKLGTGATGFTGIQEKNTQVGTLNNNLSTDIAKALIPGFGELAAQELDPNSVPVLAAAQSLPPDQQRAYGSNINAMATRLPESLEEMKGLDAGDISKLGFQDPQGRWSNYMNTTDRYNEIQNAGNDWGSISEIAFNVGKIDPAKLQTDVRNNNALRALGFGGSGSFGVVDADGDGRIDSSDAIKSRLAGNKPTLKNAANDQLNTQGKSAYTDPSIPGAGLPAPELNTKVYAGDAEAVKRAVFDRVGPAAAKGYLTEGDISSAYDTPNEANPGRIYKLRELSVLKNSPGLTSQARTQIDQIINKFQTQNAQSRVQDTASAFETNKARMGEGGALQWAIDSMSNLLNDSGYMSRNYQSGEAQLRSALQGYQDRLNQIRAEEEQFRQNMLAMLSRQPSANRGKF